MDENKRRRYEHEFKISVVSDLKVKAGKSPVQISREHDIHPSLPSKWRDELVEKSNISEGI
jgi:transposase-like protein